MATEIQLDTAINTANSAKSLRELGKSLRELVALQGQVGEGTADFKKLQKAINDTEGRVGDLNDSFGTLRGSGIERVNSSLGLFRDGLNNADPSKLSIALEGLSGAMKAIPIFLLIEGIKLLVENFDKLTIAFSDSAKEAKANEEALRKLTIEIDLQNASIDSNLIKQEQQLFLLKEQGAPLDAIISKLKEIDALKQTKLQNELKKTDKEIFNIVGKITAAKKDIETATELESLFGLTATQEDINKLEDELAKLGLRRAEVSNQILSNEINTDNKLIEEKKAYNKKLSEEQERAWKEELERINTARKRREELRQRELDEVRNTYAELEAMQKKSNEKQAETEDIYFLSTLEKGKKEFEIEQAERQKHLEGRLDKIEQEKEKELQTVTEGSEAAYLIEKKYAEMAFQEKAKQYSKYLDFAKQGAQIANDINKILVADENYALQQMQYQKDADLENNKNRTQEQIDLEVKKTNDLISNENLTAEQIERIKFDSENRINNIQAQSANSELEIKQELDKQALEIRRKQFDREKKIQLTTAGINTAAAILSALGTVQPFPAALVAAGGAAITGGIQIAAIANSKFDDGGASARQSIQPIKTIDTRKAPSSGNVGGGQQNGTTQGQLLGSGLTTNSNGLLKVYVSERDIREVSSKVDVLESRSTFGI